VGEDAAEECEEVDLEVEDVVEAGLRRGWLRRCCETARRRGVCFLRMPPGMVGRFVKERLD
jgi:hypothetical protein